MIKNNWPSAFVDILFLFGSCKLLEKFTTCNLDGGALM